MDEQERKRQQEEANKVSPTFWDAIEISVLGTKSVDDL